MAERITKAEEIEDFDKFINAHYKALEELKEKREEINGLKSTIDELKESVSPENIEKWKQRAIKQAVTTSLQSEGIKNPERILKYMKLDGIDFNEEDDSLTGLDEKLGEVKTDFPELFDVKRRAGSQSVDIHAKSPAQTKMTGTEAQVARLMR